MRKRIKTSTISVERLLQFKRAEKPPTAFWEEFGRELHQKTLQALVQPDPWYLRWAKPIMPAVYALIPISVMATIALSVMYVQDRQVPVAQFAVEDLPIGPAVSKDQAQGTAMVRNATLPAPPKQLSVSSVEAVFVVDIIGDRAGASESFSRVMAPQTFNVSARDNSIYVVDPLVNSSSGFRARTTPVFDYF